MDPIRTKQGWLAGLLCLMCGCATPGFLKFNHEDYPRASAKNPVTEVVALWQPSRGTDGNGRTCRGFSGQVYFFSKEGPIPAVVDGGVMIYVFDDQGAPEERVKPIHQFQYTPEAWHALAHQGRLGVTYGVFVPYTREGNHEAQCTLRIHYTPRDGAAVYSEMVNVELPGTKRGKEPAESGDEGESESNSLSRVQQVSYADTARKSGLPSNSRIEQLAAEAGLAALAPPARPKLKELTPEEEERIIRETRARLSREQSEESASEGSPAAGSLPRRAAPARRNPLADQGENSDESDGPSAARGKMSPSRGTAHRLHVLSEEGDETEAEANPAGHLLEAPASRRNPLAPDRAPRAGRHVLDESPGDSTDNRRRLETFTIGLSGNP